MKKVEMTFQFEDEQYEMLEEEAKSLAMTVEELMANTFSVILHEIQDDVAARTNNANQKEDAQTG